MMAEMSTPRKCYYQDKCVMCCMHFSSTEVTPSGRKINIDICMKKKLKLSDTIKNELNLIVGQTISFPDGAGICIKCRRQTAAILKKESEVTMSKQSVLISIQKMMDSEKTFTVKRLLRSPSVCQPMKKVFSPKVQLWPKTQLKTISQLQVNI